MTINFPFPLIKSNSLSDSVWRWCLGVCAALQPFPRRDLYFCRGRDISPGMSPGTKATAGGQLVVLAEMWIRGEAEGAGWEHGEGWWLPRSREIQHCWLPASSLHSQITAVSRETKHDSLHCPPLSQQSHRAAVRRFSHLHLPLVRAPACLSSSPLLREQPALVLVTGIWAINPSHLWFAGSDAPQLPCRNTRWSLARAGVGGSAPVCFSGTGSDFTGDFRQAGTAGN